MTGKLSKIPLHWSQPRDSVSSVWDVVPGDSSVQPRWAPVSEGVSLYGAALYPTPSCFWLLPSLEVVSSLFFQSLSYHPGDETKKCFVFDFLFVVNIPRSYLLPEKAMAPHSSTLAWKIPRTEEPGRLQSMGSLKVGHDWSTSLSLFTFQHWRRKWQPTPVFLPGESQRRGSPVGCRLWGRTESDMAEAT